MRENDQLRTRKMSFHSANIAITRRDSFSSLSLGIHKAYDISEMKDSENSGGEVSIAAASCNTTGTTHDATSNSIVIRSRNWTGLAIPLLEIPATTSLKRP